MSNVTVICPTYRNPKCLDIFLKSAVENRKDPNNHIMIVVDGFYEESQDVLSKYKDRDVLIMDLGTNHGMQYAQNVGAMQAETKYMFIVNDDNVLPTD